MKNKKDVWKEELKTLGYAFLAVWVFRSLSGLSGKPLYLLYKLDYLLCALFCGAIGSLVYALFFCKKKRLERFVYCPMIGTLVALVLFCLLQSFYHFLSRHFLVLMLPGIVLTCFLAGLLAKPILQLMTMIVNEILRVNKKNQNNIDYVKEK